MMKTIKLLSFLGIIFLWLPLTSSAQTASPVVAPDLLIVDYKLGPFRDVFVSDPGPAPYHGGQPEPLTPAQSSVIKPSDRDRPR